MHAQPAQAEDLSVRSAGSEADLYSQALPGPSRHQQSWNALCEFHRCKSHPQKPGAADEAPAVGSSATLGPKLQWSPPRSIKPQEWILQPVTSQGQPEGQARLSPQSTL